MINSEYLNVEQAAAELSLSKRAILHRINAGTLAAEKVGSGRTSAFLIPRSEIERSKAIA